jgi:hypothetical protein
VGRRKPREVFALSATKVGRRRLFDHPLRKMTAYDWVKAFRACYEKALRQYQGGNRDLSSYFSDEDQAFLESIGGKTMELYDFAEDFPEVDWETALLIASARRDYFLIVQNGQLSPTAIRAEDLPEKAAEFAGIPWLPRLIQKAKARLRGELPRETMYCCGGDRRFFKEHDIHPADFLRLIWAVDADEERVLQYIRARPNPSEV